MDLNEIKLPDLHLFSTEGLQQELIKTFSKYQDIKLLLDERNQEIYDLKRNLQTATAAESYLSQEVEFLLNNQNAEKEKVKEKYLHEVQDLKRQILCMKDENTAFERKAEELIKENEVLQKGIEKLKITTSQEVEVKQDDGPTRKELELEKENLDLLAKIDHLRQKECQSVMIQAETERQMEVLREELQCMKENLKAKKEELEEKTNILESTQEQIMEMNAELAALKSQPENENRKGNSLFAEVDDQRKALMKKLSDQKKSYLYMKKKLSDSELDIRRLKRENAAMQKEFQTCAAIFLNSEKMFIDKLNERIKQLLQQNEDLERKLNWTQEKLIDLSNNKGINWLDSMLQFCRNETKELKAELHNCRFEKGTLDSNLRNCQQELAKWRFEALRSRCVIIDRESLLEENGIKFKDLLALKIRISETELEKSSPQITSKENVKSFTSNANNYNKENESLKQNETPLKINLNSAKKSPADSCEFVEQKAHQSLVNKIEISKNSFMSGESIEVPHGINKIKFEMNDSHQNKTDEEKHKDISFEIYENTTQQLPVIKSSGSVAISFKEKPYYDLSKSEELGHESNAIELSPGEVKNSPELKESVSPPSTNFFHIYEDTTTHAPFSRAKESKIKYTTEIDANSVLAYSDEIKENCSSVANPSFVADDSQAKRSILVKTRDIFNEDSKSVTFDENTKDNVGNSKPIKLKKPSSNVIIKTIRIPPRVKNK